jgi:hypothetical protein
MAVSLVALIFQVGAHNMAYGLVTLVICQAISILLTKLDAKFTVYFVKDFKKISYFSGRANEVQRRTSQTNQRYFEWLPSSQTLWLG